MHVASRVCRALQLRSDGRIAIRGSPAARLRGDERKNQVGTCCCSLKQSALQSKKGGFTKKCLVVQSRSELINTSTLDKHLADLKCAYDERRLEAFIGFSRGARIKKSLREACRDEDSGSGVRILLRKPLGYYNRISFAYSGCKWRSWRPLPSCQQ